MHAAVNGHGYDIGRIREDFPILSLQVHGKPLVYLDNAASAQKPKAVLERMNQVYAAEYANVHRGLHYHGASRQPPPVALPAGTAGRGAEMGSRRR